MTHAKKIKPLSAAYWFAFLLVFILLGLYGKELVSWVLTKLYETFIEKNTGLPY